jgi:hypothetical protein
VRCRRTRLVGWRRYRRQAALAEALEDGPSLIEESVSAFVLTTANKSQCPGEHVGCKEFHATLNNVRVRRNRR